MFYLTKPDQVTVDSVLRQSGSHVFTYGEVGATRGTLPEKYQIDRNRVQIGTGKAIFETAKQAIFHWEHFNLGWVSVHGPSTIDGFAPIRAGTVVGVLAQTTIWSLNPCRITYVVDESVDGCDRFGFCYGTLPGHAESGEERFLVERCADDSVWYDILAFSRPHHFLARIGHPVVRRLQKRFARDSKTAMVRACEDS